MSEVDLIVEMAQQVEAQDPIDWAMLAVDENTAYRLIATSILEQFGKDTDRITMLSTITKLVVENFVLNLKLLQKEQDGN